MSTWARPSAASLLLSPMSKGLSLGAATGFVVVTDAAKYVVTNRHVVRGRANDVSNRNLHPSGAWPDSIQLMHHVEGRLGVWQERVEPLYNDRGDPLWLEHPVFRERADVVALPLTNTAGLDFYGYDPEADGAAITIGISKPLFIIGFPFGATGGGALGIWVQGSIATELDEDWSGLPTFLVDSRTRPGQSGSPVIAYHHSGAVAMEDGSTHLLSSVERFVGVYSGRINQESDLGIVWKKSVVSEIIHGGVKGCA